LIKKEDVMKGYWVRISRMAAVFGLLLGIWAPFPNEAKAQSTWDVPKYEYDPFWPGPLPHHWVTGEVGGVCVDAQDHIFIIDRDNLYPKEKKNSAAAPPVIEFDQEGNVVNAWGDRNLLPGKSGSNSLHGCFFDKDGNFWTAGNHDGVIQEWSHDGSKMLLQIGTKGKFDSAYGTDSRGSDDYYLNSSHTSFNSPTDVAVDPTNGDIYVSDGYGNRRVAVFDREGHFLRQWGREGSVAEEAAGLGGVFLKHVHCVVIGNDGLVYVCDRQGDRVQIFDKMGNYKRSIVIDSDRGVPHYASTGTAQWIAFSSDPEQRLMYDGDATDDEILIIDRATGKVLSRIGHPGHYSGKDDPAIASPHSIAVDHEGNIYVAQSLDGRNVLKLKVVK
jgi:DNA-binding beta-propeller fold protein YncE